MKTNFKNTLTGIFLLFSTVLMATQTGSLYNSNQQQIMNFTVEDETCFNQNNGSIEIDIVNGQDYWFSWDNGMNGQNIYNLSAGIYRVKIESTSGEIMYGSFTVYSPDYLQGYITQEIIGETVNLDLTVQGGTEPYTYIWNDSETSEDLIGVTNQGINEVTIIDANGCYLNLSTYVVIEETASLIEETMEESKINGTYDLNGKEVNLDYAPSGIYLIVNKGKTTKIYKN